MDDIQKNVSESLKKAALNEEAKSYIMEHTELFALLRRAAHRYIAGDERNEAIKKVWTFNKGGLPCTVDYMGESIRKESEANDATEEFLNLAESIKSENLNSTISLDLSHIGLSVNKELCFYNLASILKSGIEVMLSAEGIERTDDVQDTFMRASQEYSNVGITLQAYLHRSEEDLKKLMRCPGKIRIVKGAFDTPTGLSLNRGGQLDNRYLAMVKHLLKSGHKCSIATHDPKIQKLALNLLEEIGNPKHYEFESLLGIQNDNLMNIGQTHPARVYIVYGKEWYLYLCNRLAEYPPSIFQAISDIINRSAEELNLH